MRLAFCGNTSQLCGGVPASGQRGGAEGVQPSSLRELDLGGSIVASERREDNGALLGLFLLWAITEDEKDRKDSC